jgi:hypothetical protein
VFMPSGTMFNQVALLVRCRPGDEIIAADMAHIFTSEAGGGSALAGAQTWPLQTERGIFSVTQVESALRTTGGHHSPRSRVVAVEQTVNRSGGTVWPLDTLESVGAWLLVLTARCTWTVPAFSIGPAFACRRAPSHRKLGTRPRLAPHRPAAQSRQQRSKCRLSAFTSSLVEKPQMRLR